MVKPTLEEIRASDLTPLERELALASFGAEALAEVSAKGAQSASPAASRGAGRGRATAGSASVSAASREPATAASGEPAAEAFSDANADAALAPDSATDSDLGLDLDLDIPSSPASLPSFPPYDPALDSNPHVQAWRGRLDALRERNAIARPMRACGRLTRAAGLVLEAVGLRLSVGAEVMIELPQGSSLPMAEAEVVGFSGDKLFLMPTTEVIGLLPGARVFPLESAPIADPNAGAKRLPVGWELLGRVLDASGRPLDGLGPLGTHSDAPLSAPVINPLNREPIHKVLDVGVRAINALLTVGRGQRMGLFAGSGVGKSVLLGTMARYTSAEVIVIGLIGERGREVKEFIEQILGEEGLARSVVIAAPADVSPLLRMQAASYSTSLAEYFRDQGKHVLLLMDSLTRYAMAQREIALAVGEPPATKGYPPSVFAKLPALVERTGNGPEGGGSITAFYTVLTEGDDQQDPIADSARAILDGHIVLSRSLAEAGHYPAIDIEASISRAMTALIDENHLNKTRMFKQMLSRYQRNRDLINVGAYSSGRDAVLDRAIALYPRMEAFLQQGFRECANFEPSVGMLDALFA
jgi:flagellum-specific ATP synthase